MRLFVAGRQGQVARALSALGDDGLTIVALGRPELDIADEVSVRRALYDARPDVVVNAAAYTAVDRAETDEAAAMAVNRDGAMHLAAAAAALGLPIIQLSTDYVYSGDKAEPYVETDPTGPLGAYGRSKLAGEQAVAAANPRHAILRTAWVYDAAGSNFLTTMLRLAGERDEVRVVADQFGTPTYAPDIADAILVVAAAMLHAPDEAWWRGVFHMVAGGETSWAGFATEIFRQSAAAGGPSAQVTPIASAEYPTLAHRPANSRLSTSRFRNTFGHALPPWQNGIARCIDALQTG